ncbi:unnamed protein product [Blepharisma stoltei]|uniref:Uncharacterized protein n=1 Tax=Blepharisma stoltei TaxID=1481888 RepID=A0AAU9JBV0_9CILI|nr:unnamed protein product [Blepharisma stoltei]
MDERHFLWTTVYWSRSYMSSNSFKDFEVGDCWSDEEMNWRSIKRSILDEYKDENLMGNLNIIMTLNMGINLNVKTKIRARCGKCWYCNLKRSRKSSWGLWLNA